MEAEILVVPEVLVYLTLKVLKVQLVRGHSLLPMILTGRETLAEHLREIQGHLVPLQDHGISMWKLQGMERDIQINKR